MLAVTTFSGQCICLSKTRTPANHSATVISQIFDIFAPAKFALSDAPHSAGGGTSPRQTALGQVSPRLLCTLPAPKAVPLPS